MMSSLITSSSIKRTHAEECNICMETQPKHIQCEYCSMKACRSCCERYILGEGQTTIKCMNISCNREWSRKFISSHFTQTFITGPLNEHRKTILFDKERAKFPYTLQKMDELDKLNREYNEDYDKYIINYIVKEQIEDIWREIGIGKPANEKKYDDEFINKCPTIDCNGILNSEWHCILCNIDACPSCHEIKHNQEHKCNSDTIETIKMIKKDTKPCPKCYTKIYKIDGCDQMWCVKCHTAFSWTTGAIEKKIHNPHYYEWMRKNSVDGIIPREIGDNPCGGEIDAGYYTNEMQSYFIDEMLSDDVHMLINAFTNNVMHLFHLEEVVLQRYVNEEEPEYDFVMRCKFLRKEIDEKKYKSFLERKAKTKSKNEEVTQLVQLWIDAKKDILMRMLDIVKTSASASVSEVENEKPLNVVLVSIHNQKKILKEMNKLDEYINNIAREIEKTYKNSVNLL